MINLSTDTGSWFDLHDSYWIVKLIYLTEIVILPSSEVVNRDKIVNKPHCATVFSHKLKREKYHRTREQNSDILSTLFL